MEIKAIPEKRDRKLLNTIRQINPEIVSDVEARIMSECGWNAGQYSYRKYGRVPISKSAWRDIIRILSDFGVELQN